MCLREILPPVTGIPVAGGRTVREPFSVLIEVANPSAFFLMIRPLHTLILTAAALLPLLPASLSAAEGTPGRERLLLNEGWRFALGDSRGGTRDFDAVPVGTAFNYFSKAGRAEGAAAEKFDDSQWQEVTLPHDWAVALPFDARGSHSHGYKALGKLFPENSVGWYRRKFVVPQEDLGRRIFVEFDGIFRDSRVWVNGFYLGTKESGYASFAYDMTEYLSYGGENTIVVRADASLEEGWFYEGAGIYRNVWLLKTAPVHVARHGVFVRSDLSADLAAATVKASATVRNDSPAEAVLLVRSVLFSPKGEVVAQAETVPAVLAPAAEATFESAIPVKGPALWDIEHPNLYRLATIVVASGKEIDRVETRLGIRKIEWTASDGFHLNGKRVQINGTNNHQDHAGVGAAIGDSLNYERIRLLKEMGCNALRTSHNPPTPEVLDACDELGMLVLDETRETGVNEKELGDLREMILRDRNHPSVILWSVGNEEWALEGNSKGALVTRRMQDYGRLFDDTRPFTVAISGGWGVGSSTTTEVMGFNYFNHGDMDAFHAQFPDKPTVGTEEGAGCCTRGIYVQDMAACLLPAYDRYHERWFVLAGESVPHYEARKWAAGAFRWTGFDYRGEPSPFGWPAIASGFGVMDTCGFPKDTYFYYKAWWTKENVIHVLPHWNWKGSEGKPIEVWVFSNAEEVELFLNGKSLGKKTMEKFGHLEWSVPFAPGKLLARGYMGGKAVMEDFVETTGAPASVRLIPRKTTLAADGDDVSLVTVEVLDAQGRAVPDADTLVRFALSGPGRIVGVGNGSPVSHEADQFPEGMVWQRSLFNGLAQVIVKTRRGEPGKIALSATAEGLAPARVEIAAATCPLKPSVPVLSLTEPHNASPVPVLVEVDMPANDEKKE
jgi:beta-galactosidase